MFPMSIYTQILYQSVLPAIRQRRMNVNNSG